MQIDDVSRFLLHVQNNWDIGFSFQTFFFFITCALVLFKIEKDFNIDDYKIKSTWKWENSFLNIF
jgi:hypothetical protein